MSQNVVVALVVVVGMTTTVETGHPLTSMVWKDGLRNSRYKVNRMQHLHCSVFLLLFTLLYKLLTTFQQCCGQNGHDHMKMILSLNDLYWLFKLWN